MSRKDLPSPTCLPHCWSNTHSAQGRESLYHPHRQDSPVPPFLHPMFLFSVPHFGGLLTTLGRKVSSKAASMLTSSTHGQVEGEESGVGWGESGLNRETPCSPPHLSTSFPADLNLVCS